MKALLAIAGMAALACACANVPRASPQAGTAADTSVMGAAAAADLGFHGPVYRDNAQYGQ